MTPHAPEEPEYGTRMPSTSRRCRPALSAGLAALLAALLLAPPGSAQPSAPPPARAVTPASPPLLPLRRAAPEVVWERNNLPMMISGISLTTLGVVAIGMGLGLLFHGRQECDADATALVRASGVVTPAAYQVAYDRCTRSSAFVNGGLGAVVGGGVFAGLGVPFTIAGAWRLRVDSPRESGARLRLGPAGVAFEGVF